VLCCAVLCSCRSSLEDEVLSSMAQLDTGPLPEEAVLPLLERLAPPPLDDAVAARAEAADDGHANTDTVGPGCGTPSVANGASVLVYYVGL
jgi:hypothetical protein